MFVLQDNPESKLCKIYGLYRLSLNHSLPRMGGRKKFYFIIMESVFYTARYIHLIYDLKGIMMLSLGWYVFQDVVS